MDPAIRPVQPGPRAPDAVRRRREEERPFDLERELARRGDEECEGEQPRARHDPEETPVGPRPDDEAGSHLDLTA